ncbi:Cu2+-exporting ATPase [Alternaria panax]|uniref:Cu2+-exporting ATPase n=1 Tax=Alternaria panax TaxID=48097 RepID=A0AAD4IKA7_9PLEO|nr:Cu2+-exporting ATPase [Alternaria panax]
MRFVKASSRFQAKHFLLLNFSTCGSRASHCMSSAIGSAEIKSIRLLLLFFVSTHSPGINHFLLFTTKVYHLMRFIIRTCKAKANSRISSSNEADPASACTIDAKDDCCADDTQSISEDTCAGSCCESEQTDCAETTTKAPKASYCTSSPKSYATTGTDPSCCPPKTASNCCTHEKVALVNMTEIVSGSDTIDMERGGVTREHVIISVSGMTCTGCETKLQRTLGSLDYVSKLQTSLVLARVELDINTNLATADDVVRHLHRTTEFKCEIVSNQGCSLDFICSEDPAALINGQWPDGVLDVRRLSKQCIRVDYDAKIIGARDLMGDEWSQSFQLAQPCPDSSLEAGSRHVRNMGLLTLLSVLLTIPVLVMTWAPIPNREIAHGSASFALATIVQVVIAGPFYPKALKALVFSKVIEMDLLIVLSTSAAYIFSVVAFGYLVSGNPLSTGEFFETSTLLVTLIMVGRWVASLARQKAAESISIRSLQTPTAVLVDNDGMERGIDARLLQYGDTFRVVPDSRIPTDGTVISGSSEIDESMLTGEAQPVEKHTKSAVMAGTINGSGTLTVRLTRLPGDNTITTIAGMVDEAKLSKPKIQEIADTVASYFVPVVVALTIITFVIWIAIGVGIRHQSGSEATIEAITVLIVSCPCAIGLAVPMVIVIASGAAAKRGVVFKTAGSIEVAYRTTDVVFDKTGTLTAGKLAVVREEYVGDSSAEEAKSLLGGLLGPIKHPVSAAIATHLASQGLPISSISDAKVVTGKGVEGTFHGKKLRAGNSRWLALSDNPRVRSMLSQGFTTFCFTIDNTLVAVFGLQDTLRPDAASTISRLRCSGINVHVLSGDDDGAVREITSLLDVPEDNVHSRCSPTDKQTYIKDLLTAPSTAPSTGKSRKPIVMFVGDGTNDAVALAQATIGVHVSSGTDIAQSAADVVLVRPSLSGVLTIINVSRKAIHRIVFNFVWSFVYNTFAILLGAGAFVHARIPPEFAGLGELVSVLPVVLAAVLLKWSKV